MFKNKYAPSLSKRIFNPMRYAGSWYVMFLACTVAKTVGKIKRQLYQHFLYSQNVTYNWRSLYFGQQSTSMVLLT